MSHEAFLKLLDLLRPMVAPDIRKSHNSCDNPIYPELVLAIGLRWLAGGSYLDLKNVYVVSQTSVYRCRDIFINAVLNCNELRIRFPETAEEFESIRRQFQKKVQTLCFVAAVEPWMVCLP